MGAQVTIQSPDGAQVKPKALAEAATAKKAEEEVAAAKKTKADAAAAKKAWSDCGHQWIGARVSKCREGFWRDGTIGLWRAPAEWKVLYDDGSNECLSKEAIDKELLFEDSDSDPFKL